jgi:hypothetical protein
VCAAANQWGRSTHLSAGQEAQYRLPSLSIDDPFRAILSGVLDAAIVAAAPIEVIVSPNIALASPVIQRRVPNAFRRRAVFGYEDGAAHPCCTWSGELNPRNNPASAKKWHRTRGQFGISCFEKRRSASDTPAKSARKCHFFAGNFGERPLRQEIFLLAGAPVGFSDERGGERSIDGVRLVAEQLSSKCEQMRRIARDRPGEHDVACLISVIKPGQYVRRWHRLELAVQDVHARRVTGPSNRDGLPSILLSESEVPFGWSRASNGKTGSESASCHRPGTAC